MGALSLNWTRRDAAVDPSNNWAYRLVMVGDGSSSRPFIADTSPLIYLATIGALEALAVGGTVLITTGVRDEAVLSRATYRFPEAVEIETAINRGLIEVTPLTAAERELATSIGARVPALGRGEREVIAVSIERSLDAVMFDRRARRVARALGASVVDMFEVVFRGAGNAELLEHRVRALASLVDLRLGAMEELLDRIGRMR